METATTTKDQAPRVGESEIQIPMAQPELSPSIDEDKFLMFVRVLMKYLEQKDPAMHLEAKAIINDCAERNKRQEMGYESVTACMRIRLHEAVGEAYWTRAGRYLALFLSQKAKDQTTESQTAVASFITPTAASPPANLTSGLSPESNEYAAASSESNMTTAGDLDVAQMIADLGLN